jgi:hypothetical protein
MTRTALLLAIGAMLLTSAAHADSIKGQENAEIAYCVVETNTMRPLPCCGLTIEAMKTETALHALRDSTALNKVKP